MTVIAIGQGEPAAWLEAIREAIFRAVPGSSRAPSAGPEYARGHAAAPDIGTRR